MKFWMAEWGETTRRVNGYDFGGQGVRTEGPLDVRLKAKGSVRVHKREKIIRHRIRLHHQTIVLRLISQFLSQFLVMLNSLFSPLE